MLNLSALTVSETRSFLTKPVVMIVEDHQDLRDVLKFHLKRNFDVEVLEFSSGYEALQNMPFNFSGTILCDLKMPAGDGMLLYQHLKTQGLINRVQFAIWTSHRDLLEGFREVPVFDKLEFSRIMRFVEAGGVPSRLPAKSTG